MSEDEWKEHDDLQEGGGRKMNDWRFSDMVTPEDIYISTGMQCPRPFRINRHRP